MRGECSRYAILQSGRGDPCAVLRAEFSMSKRRNAASGILTSISAMSNSYSMQANYIDCNGMTKAKLA